MASRSRRRLRLIFGLPARRPSQGGSSKYSSWQQSGRLFGVSRLLGGSDWAGPVPGIRLVLATEPPGVTPGITNTHVSVGRKLTPFQRQQVVSRGRQPGSRNQNRTAPCNPRIPAGTTGNTHARTGPRRRARGPAGRAADPRSCGRRADRSRPRRTRCQSSVRRADRPASPGRTRGEPASDPAGPRDRAVNAPTGNRPATAIEHDSAFPALHLRSSRTCQPRGGGLRASASPMLAD